MFMCLKSPVPYFWVVTSLATHASALLEPATWRRIFLVAYTIVPAVLAVYACCILRATRAKIDVSGANESNLRTLVTRRNNVAKLLATKGWFMKKLHFIMGGFAIDSGQSSSGSLNLEDKPSQKVRSQEAEDTTGCPPVIQKSKLDTTSQISVCLMDDHSSLWILKQVSPKKFTDDRSFFMALRSFVGERSRLSWPSILSAFGLRKPVGIYFVRVRLFFFF